MPEIRYYTVTQEREVKISASNTLEAAKLADAAFSNTLDRLPIGSDRNVLIPIRVRELIVREDY